MALARLIYVSEPQLDPAHGSTITQLGAIMAASRRNNEAAGITGALAYDESWFIQVLEGERRTIWKTFARIGEDDRHTGCLLIEMADIEARLFGKWWMGLATRGIDTVATFLPYLVNGALRADTMSARDILTLMAALAKIGLNRDMRTAA